MIKRTTLSSKSFCFLYQVSFLAFSACASIDKSNAPVSQGLSLSDESPQNLILFIGDGMGVSTVTAARIFDGQSIGLMGEEHSLAFEDFQNLALIKTYNANSQVPDSAGTATAIMSGYKANIGAVNVEPGSRYQGCQRGAEVPLTLSERGIATGKAVGIVSTARLTHATPAAMYGHADKRGWESDSEIPLDAKMVGCLSLAQQLVDSKIDIALGGGKAKFSAAQISSLKQRYYYTSDREQLFAAPKDRKVRGLFAESHMSFDIDRDPVKEPSLAEMTEFSIDRLSENDNGYILLVEAGRVDHAHHGTNAYRALTDMQALNEAVKVAKVKASHDTLILVTADHSHVFTMAGYPVRGNPILGLVREADREKGGAESAFALAGDGRPYTTLGYYNGENVRKQYGAALTHSQVSSKDYLQEVAIKMDSETHGGEDVALYATGPGAQNVRGLMDQAEIGQLIAKELGLK